MPTVLRPKVRIIATKTMDIKAMVEAMVMVMMRQWLCLCLDTHE